MIESKILGSAAGIQRQGVIDKTESTVLPSLSNGVFMGRFKRGRMDKPFKVTSDNYRSLLGHDPSNPSYLAVEDCFKRGVSEISILRVGSTGESTGGIACIPSNALMREDTQLPFARWMTVSRNGGEFVTFDLDSDDTDFNALQSMTTIGQDGKSIAFIEYPYMIDSNPSSGGGIILASVIEVSEPSDNYSLFAGISTNGIIVTPDGEKDLKDLRIRYPLEGSHKPNSRPRIEHNWLVFKPTPNANPDEDVFYRMGATGNTLEVHSCAVMEKYIDPNVCMPTYNETLFSVRNGDANPMGTVHAKYRINGGPWEYYTNNDPDVYNVVEYFLDGIYYNDWKMVHIGGGNGSAAFATGYHAANIYGASATTDYVYDQDGIVSNISHTIEFAVTENSRNDLVYLAFGKDTTIKSCAIGSWMGY